MTSDIPIQSTRDENPEISVITVTCNTRKYLADCLDSLRRDASGKLVEVIVVDNDSSDGTREMVKKEYPEVRLLEMSQNLGMCKAVNQGFRVARGKYIAIFDVDTVIAPDVLGECSAYLDANPDVGTVAAKLLYPDGRVQVTARNFPGAMNGLFGRHTFLSKLFPNNRFSRNYLRRADHNRIEPYDVDWVSAACMMFPKATAERLGGLDEGFFGYWVDADWCMRIHKQGLRVVSLPSVTMIHAEQYQPWRKKRRIQIVTFHKGAYRFYRKHYVKSAFGPMGILAFAGLTLRCGMQLMLNAFKR